ncbi:hypothetical protein SARC_02418 [Sphaeroforma arctica JP610]|uniref:Translation elongation factor EFTu-like domain-containing protein n=1 Tax=Sphaeroforma arctica JP610 TaxID=667725 RepID=A0A0L0G934_9EUKA|nr:hypothetical protein SARC_02418 [Sphaeroforma arctica JP610]KNC85419.1 hypothetical protein SARC_02418 [Sphaeroforma arctica JP610]|eukprot:XP_014159321.1 hypothetical protein SARC_02418 [Sphaeroforma arctica JP610]
MVFFRVYAGTMNAKEAVDNTSRKCKEQVKRLMKVHANKYTDVSSVTAGEIAIAVGLKETMSGDTLIKLTAANGM